MWFWSHKLKSLLMKKDYETIVRLCQERVERNQTDYWTLRGLGLGLMYTGRTSEAFEWLSKCARAYPKKSRCSMISA